MMNYHQALMYLNGLYKNPSAALPASAPPSNDDVKKPKNEVEELLVKIYSNQAAVHIQKRNWQRAVETCDKGLAKDSQNSKLLFRKGKALAELGHYEKGVKILKDLLQTAPEETAKINVELAHQDALEKEREKKLKQKFKGFLNKEKNENVLSKDP